MQLREASSRFKKLHLNNSGEVRCLAHFRKFNQNKLVVAHLKINPLGDKFGFLNEKTKKC